MSDQNNQQAAREFSGQLREPYILGDFIPTKFHWGLANMRIDVIAPYLRAALAALDTAPPRPTQERSE